MTTLIALFFACGGDSPTSEAPPPAAPPPAVSATEITLTNAAAIAVLPAADAADGAVDKVVHRCASCGLGMEGDAAHSSQVHGYEFHSCSASCKDSLESDADGVVGRLEGIGSEE